MAGIPVGGQTGFLEGFNLPFFGYGHDFGRNAWGHDGLSTRGIRLRRDGDNQGFTGFDAITDSNCDGRPAARIHMSLAGGHALRQGAEAYIDLLAHGPFPCPSPNDAGGYDLEGATVRLRLWLPPGSAGPPGAPNGVQLFFASKAGNRMPTFYTPWRNIETSWEGRTVEIASRVSNQGPGHVPPGFDARRVAQAGFRIRINDQSTATLEGSTDVESLHFEPTTPAVFEFGASPADTELRGGREAYGIEAPLVRVFVLCDGRAGVRFGPGGEIEGLDDEFFADFDVLLAAAERQGALLMPVLLDFHWLNKPEVIGGVQMGGRSAVIQDAELRRGYLETALAPILQRYGQSPWIHSWDIINEPEWALAGIGGHTPNTAKFDPVPVESMRTFVRECAELVHRHTRHQVTMGSAKPSWVGLWRGLGLDLYQFHWYESFRAECPFPWPHCSELALDQPCLVGEVPTAGASIEPAEFLAASRQGGYAGLLFWSSRAQDAWSDLRAVTRTRPT